MLMVASKTLADLAPSSDESTAGILPPLNELANISKTIAFTVGKVAQAKGYTLEMSDEELRWEIERNFGHRITGNTVGWQHEPAE